MYLSSGHVILIGHRTLAFLDTKASLGNGFIHTDLYTLKLLLIVCVCVLFGTLVLLAGTNFRVFNKTRVY